MTKLVTTIVVRLGSLAGAGFPTFALRRQEGQTLVEYALVMALIALVVLSAVTFLRNDLEGLFTKIGNPL